MKDYGKMIAEELSAKAKQKKEPFEPTPTDYMGVVWGTTPLGGDVSLVYYFDKDDNHCKRENMAYSNIVIYTKDGNYVNSVAGRNPYR